MTASYTKGIVAIIISTIFFALQDAFTKHLTSTLPPWQIISIRFFFFAIFALVYTHQTIGIKNGFKSRKPLLQIFRGILIVCEITLFAYTIKFLGLAELHTLFICFPLIITALSKPFLGEHVGWRRWLAVSIGFIGTIIILRPGIGEFNLYAFFAFCCALMLAIYVLLTRKLAKYDSFETSLLYFGITGFLLSLLFAPFVWQSLNQQEVISLLLLSSCSIVGHYSLIKALQITPAVILQPFNYLVLVWAILLGYEFFGETLNSYTIIGATIVVSSGLYIAFREIINSSAKTST